MHGIENQGTMATVRFRIATATAFVLGFVLGSLRSRRTRLRIVTEVGSTTRIRTTAGTARRPRSKIRSVAVLGTVRVRDALGVRLGWRDGEDATDALVIEMTSDLATVLNSRTTLAGCSSPPPPQPLLRTTSRISGASWPSLAVWQPTRRPPNWCLPPRTATTSKGWWPVG